MPTYSIKCVDCGRPDIFFSKVSERDNTPPCPCGAKTERTLDTPMVSFWTGWKGFHLSDGKNGVGTFIESSDQYHRYLKENNKLCGDEGAREAEIQKANRLADDKKKLGAAVESAVRKHINK